MYMNWFPFYIAGIERRGRTDLQSMWLSTVQEFFSLLSAGGLIRGMLVMSQQARARVSPSRLSPRVTWLEALCGVSSRTARRTSCTRWISTTRRSATSTAASWRPSAGHPCSSRTPTMQTTCRRGAGRGMSSSWVSPRGYRWEII